MKDLIELMKKNKERYYGISKKLVRRSSYQLFRLGEKTVMPTFLNIKKDKDKKWVNTT